MQREDQDSGFISKRKVCTYGKSKQRTDIVVSPAGGGMD